MPIIVEGLPYYGQSELYEAAVQAHTAFEKDTLTLLGVASFDAAQARIQLSGDQAATIETLTAELASERAAKTEITGKYRSVTLDSAAESVGGEFKLTPVQTKQVLTLLGVKPEEFDSEKPEDTTGLMTKFETFLKLPENSHFVGNSTQYPETGRKPPAPAVYNTGGRGGGDWGKLRALVTAAQK